MPPIKDNFSIFIRRIIAFLYDLLLIFAVLVFAFTLIYLPLAMGLGMTELGEHPLVSLYLILVTVSFHLWFWKKGGQTLGMKSWRLKLVRNDGMALTWKDVFLRYAGGLLSIASLGIGTIWSLFDSEARAWQDILSATHLELVPKEKKG